MQITTKRSEEKDRKLKFTMYVNKCMDYSTSFVLKRILTGFEWFLLE